MEEGTLVGIELLFNLVENGRVHLLCSGSGVDKSTAAAVEESRKRSVGRSRSRDQGNDSKGEEEEENVGDGGLHVYCKVVVLVLY